LRVNEGVLVISASQSVGRRCDGVEGIISTIRTASPIDQFGEAVVVCTQFGIEEVVAERTNSASRFSDTIIEIFEFAVAIIQIINVHAHGSVGSIAHTFLIGTTHTRTTISVGDVLTISIEASCGLITIDLHGAVVAVVRFFIIPIITVVLVARGCIIKAGHR